MQEIFNSHLKQVNIVSALIIANTIFERFLSRFSHLFSEMTDKVTKRFYQSMKSKFLVGRMTGTSLDVFKILITIKTESIEIFENVKKSIFMNEANLKKIETKDFGPYEDIIDVFNSNLKLLFDNNIVVVNEQKLDPSIVEKYTGSLHSIQSYEYRPNYNRMKLVDDYFKALYNKVSQELNGMYSHETWDTAEVDDQIAEVLGFVLSGKYLSQSSGNILNDSTAPTNEIKADDNEIPVLVYKNELHINTSQFKVTRCFCRGLESIKEFLLLGSGFIEDQSEVAICMMKRVLDVIVVAAFHPDDEFDDNPVHTIWRGGHLQDR